MRRKWKTIFSTIIIVISVPIFLYMLDRITHWTHAINQLLIMIQNNRTERLLIICAVLLIVIIFSILLLRQYENKSGGKHETVRLILKILILTMLGNFCMSIMGGIATNELYHEVLSFDEAPNGNGKNDGFREEYISIKGNTEEKDSFQVKYKSVDKFIVGWSDNSGLEEGRPFYTIDDINNGILGDQIVFNSISDSVIGHEANFVGARENTGINDSTHNVWNANSIEVESDKTYFIRLYVHNNSPNALNAIALDTRIRFEICDTVFVNETENDEGNYQVAVYGYITSSNATPSQYMDSVKFVCERPFHLVYIFGTALFENNEIGVGGCELSDEIITKGVLIGYDEFNGEIPGCYQYDSYTTIKVMPVFDD